jgi:uncharacterized membrane protein
MMDRPRISDEWVMGATVGAYVVLTFVLHFWGSAFIHYWCGNSPYPPTTRDGRFPGFLVFLVPGVIVGVLNWAQVKLAQSRTGLLNHRAVRVALWMNLFGILGVLVIVASNYGSANDIGFFAIVPLLAIALWPLGLVVSLWNLVWGCVGLAKSPQS